MQPYFFPYIGYFQLISAADQFVVYDNIKYTKKGWINRNRLLRNGKDAMFSLPLKNDSDRLNVCDRVLAADFDREKLRNQFEGAYRRAPFFSETFPLVENIIRYEQDNVFLYVHNSILAICEHLGMTTPIRRSSEIGIDHDLKGQAKVLALCAALGADEYINAAGGVELYSQEDFRSRNIDLKFIQSKPFEYPQFGGEFVPWLSIVDVMMFNSRATVSACVAANYEVG